VAKAKKFYHAVIDLTGNVYGRLTVLGYSPSVKHQLSRWVVLCECGKKFTTYGMSLVSSKTKSCGCLQKEKAQKHGNYKHPLYKIWTSINYRCSNSSCKDYPNYGGRGIKNLFDSFENFCESMGARPSGYMVERLDVNAHYSPDNCTWIPNKQQVQNRRCSITEEKKQEVIRLSKEIKNKATIARLVGVGRTSVNRILKNCV
jgi:hypothetical protein